MKQITPILFAFLLFSFTTYAQIPKAEKLFESKEFEKAIPLYQKEVNRNAENKELATRRLGDCFRLSNNNKEAEIWYALAIDNYPENIDSSLYFYFAMTLRDNGKYEEAKEQFQNYAKSVPNNPRAKRYVGYMDEIMKWQEEAILEEAVNAGTINSPFVENLPVAYDQPGRFVFISNKSAVKGKTNKKDKFKVWVSKANVVGEKINFLRPMLLTKEDPTNKNEEVNAVSFTEDFKRMFYSRQYKKRDKAIGFEIICRDKKGANKWDEPMNFQHNSLEYSNDYPAVSADGETLYFVSDRPGGYGETDIYVSHFTNGEWDEPSNLGPDINTSGTESHLTLIDNTLYFSSNGHASMGGMDIVKSTFENGKWGRVETLRPPINSQYNDYGFFPVDENLVVFASDREGGKGEDDLYFLKVDPLESTLKGDEEEEEAGEEEATYVASVVNTEEEEEDENLIENAEEAVPQQVEEEEEIVSRPLVSVKEEDEEEVVPQQSINTEEEDDESLLENERGEIPQPLAVTEEEEEIIPQPSVNIEKEAPKPVVIPTASVVEPAPKPAPKAVVEAPKPPAPVSASSSSVQFKDIMYSFNSVYPTSNSYGNIAGLITYMRNNKNARLTIVGHSDAKGAEKLSMRVSQRRADILSAYLQSKQVSKDRIVVQAVGSSYPKNHCRTGVPCTEQELAVNRRVELVIAID